VHLNRTHHTAKDASFFDGILEGYGVVDGGEHAHVVGCDAVHVDGLLGHSTEEVTASDYDSDLATEGVNCCKLFGYFVDENSIDAEASACGQRFA
jgi:hypothetical protein